MKLHKLLLSTLLLVVFLVGCSGTIDESQWRSISSDMSIERVETELGTPKEIYSEQQAMIGELNRVINPIKDILDNPFVSEDEATASLFQTIEDLELIRNAVEKESNIKILQYELKRENGGKTTRNVYLENDRVIYYDGARQ